MHTPRTAIAHGTQLTNDEAVYYTVPDTAMGAWVDKFELLNTHATTDYTATVWIIPGYNSSGAAISYTPGAAPGDTYLIYRAITLASATRRPDTCPEMVGKWLDRGDRIVALGSAASVINIMCNVREVK